ncbi:MAG TPA: MFS transporter [Thermomicrobiales bacterium]|nr:MFS transporter [Thermomicrobiales bacterium]
MRDKNGKRDVRPDSMGAVLRNGAFLRLWLIQATTQILQNMINFALLLRVRGVVEVHDLPHANTAISLVILAFSLPAVLFGPVAGVIADRVNKRNLMAVLNAARAVAVLLFLVIRPGWDVETILAAYYIVTFLFGIAGQFFAPVLGATIPLVAKRQQLMSANALFNLTSTAAQLIGFAAAGPILIRVLGVDRLFAVTVVAYLISVALVFTLPKTPVPVRAINEIELRPMQRLWSDMKEGLVFILQDPALMRAIGYLTLASTTFLMIATLGPDFVSSVIGLPKEDIGFIVAPAGAGILAGVLIVPRIVRRIGRDWLIDISLTIAGLMLALMALTRGVLNGIVPGNAPLWTVVGFTASFAGILGLCNAFILVPSQTMLQERSHEGVRARVYATFFTVSNTVAFVPIFFAAAAADIFGVINVLIVMAFFVGGLGFFGLFHRRRAERNKWERVRTRHRQGPDAIPRRFEGSGKPVKS